MISMDGSCLIYGTWMAEHTCMPGIISTIFILKTHLMKTISIIFSVFAIILMGCKKRKGAIIVPDSLFFIIKQNGQRLDDNTLNDMKLYFFTAGSKTYITDFIRCNNEGNFNAYDSGGQTTRKIGYVSGDDNIKDFYLEYSNGDIDTLYVDYRYIGEAAYDDPCYCYYPMGVVKYNGNIASPDPAITQQRFYKFDKH